MFCTKTKYTYPDHQSALEVINRCRKNLHHKKSRKRPTKCYYCTECRGWHLTSLKSKKRKLKIIK